MLADLYCWLIRASPINTTALLHSCSPTLGLVLCVTLSDFVLIVVYFSNQSWQCVIFEIPKIHSFVFFFSSLFLSFCVLLLVSQQAPCAQGQDPSPDQSGSSTEPFLWPWRRRHHSSGQGDGGTHRQKGLSVFIPVYESPKRAWFKHLFFCVCCYLEITS